MKSIRDMAAAVKTLQDLQYSAAQEALRASSVLDALHKTTLHHISKFLEQQEEFTAAITRFRQPALDVEKFFRDFNIVPTSVLEANKWIDS